MNKTYSNGHTRELISMYLFITITGFSKRHFTAFILFSFTCLMSKSFVTSFISLFTHTPTDGQNVLGRGS